MWSQPGLASKPPFVYQQRSQFSMWTGSGCRSWKEQWKNNKNMGWAVIFAFLQRPSVINRRIQEKLSGCSSESPAIQRLIIIPACLIVPKFSAAGLTATEQVQYWQVSCTLPLMLRCPTLTWGNLPSAGEKLALYQWPIQPLASLLGCQEGKRLERIVMRIHFLQVMSCRTLRSHQLGKNFSPCWPGLDQSERDRGKRLWTLLPISFLPMTHCEKCQWPYSFFTFQTSGDIFGTSSAVSLYSPRW